MISWIRFLHIVNLILLADGGEQYDVKNPNSFQLFENDELCQEVFSRELAAVKNLKRLRVILGDHKREITNALDEEALKKSQRSVVEVKKSIDDLTSEFPTVEDFQGAQRAMMALQDTYNFDPLQLVSDGKIFLSRYARTGTNLTLPGDHRLSWRDVSDMASLSFRRRRFDTAIAFLRSTFDAIKLAPKEERPSKVEYKRMVSFRKELAAWNNKYLLKTRVLVDSEHRVAV